MCINFKCLRNSLILLNLIYIVVGFVLIYVSVSGKFLFTSYSGSVPVATGIEICGIFLIGLSVLGIVGAAKHHQVILFFYMVILSILCITQGIVSYASITISEDRVHSITNKSWENMTSDGKCSFKDDYKCCIKYGNTTEDLCSANCHLQKFHDSKIDSLCTDQLADMIKNVFTMAGRLGMFCSYIDLIGIWLTKRYRNQKDPRAHPSAFL